MKTALIAVGGNTLIRAGETGHVPEQRANAQRTSLAIAQVVAGGYSVVVSNLADVIGGVDVLYQTRIRDGRVRNREDASRYAITAPMLQRMRPDSTLLHPLPRTVELDRAVDDDPRAQYFQQATNGLFVRMALLTMLWGS